MKKIVAFLSTVPGEEHEKAASTAHQAGPALDDDDPAKSPASDGAMKLEATVSDELAQRVISILLNQENGMRDDANLERLLQREIEIAGPNAHDLFKRIVVGVERQLLGRVYAECNGVKTRAAARLGIDRNTLHKKLRQHHLAED